MFFGATVGLPRASTAQTIGTGGLTATISGNDIVLSFPTISGSLYTVQASPNSSPPWTDLQSAIQGDGTVKTVIHFGALAAGSAFYRLLIQPQPIHLLLPQSNAFAILGHSCGGIQEQVYGTGFDPTSGYPTGNVYIQTRCGGSGRGGGYHTTTYSAWVDVTWDFVGNVISSTALSNAATVDPTFTATDAYGDIISNAGTVAYLIVPAPGAPTDVTAIQANDQFDVAWTPTGVNPSAITSSVLTATPVNSTNSVLTTNVTGSATNGVIPFLQPGTTYQVTVVNSTSGGAGAPSTPVTVATSSISIPPSVPTNVAAYWLIPDPPGSTDTLVATWEAPNPGDSPIDEYLITITGSDGGGKFTQTVDGATLTASFDVNDVPNWSVTVQAHNSFGWGLVSAAYKLGGL